MMESALDHAELIDLLDYTHAQLSKIREAVAASNHAGAMFTIDCLIGAAAEQTKCKLAGLEHAGMPVGRDGPVSRDGPVGNDGAAGRDAPAGASGAAARFQARAAKPDVGKAAMRVRRLP